MNDHVLTSLKAYTALIGAIATALLGVYAADSEVGKILTVLAVIATAVGTWAVPNKQPVYNEGHLADFDGGDN
jgi:FtsH-binding integral membrane protein